MSISLDFGWGRAPMRKQLARISISSEIADALDEDADAIIRLHMRRILTDAERDRAIRRATKRLEQAMKAKR